MPRCDSGPAACTSAADCGRTRCGSAIRRTVAGLTPKRRPLRAKWFGILAVGQGPFPVIVADMDLVLGGAVLALLISALTAARLTTQRRTARNQIPQPAAKWPRAERISVVGIVVSATIGITGLALRPTSGSDGHVSATAGTGASGVTRTSPPAAVPNAPRPVKPKSTVTTRPARSPTPRHTEVSHLDWNFPPASGNAFGALLVLGPLGSVEGEDTVQRFVLRVSRERCPTKAAWTEVRTGDRFDADIGRFHYGVVFDQVNGGDEPQVTTTVTRTDRVSAVPQACRRS
jgi:hypothetical protein